MLIRSESPSSEFLGMASDRRLLSWFSSYAQQTPSLLRFLANPLSSLTLPSMYLYTSVVAAKETDSVLEAMRLMSEEGVSTIAVIDEKTGRLLSAVSVSDIGKVSLLPQRIVHRSSVHFQRSSCRPRVIRSCQLPCTSLCLALRYAEVVCARFILGLHPEC